MTNLVLQCQSGTTADSSIFKVAGTTIYENVEFSDQHDPYMVDMDSQMDPTRSMQDTDDATLENFFSRPVKISEEEWNTVNDLNYDVNPWQLYFNNPRVINRLTNFNLLKANLRVKIVINGNGFQYGRMLVGYLPVPTYDNLSGFIVDGDLTQLSQLPHVFLNPTLSLGGEMKLPMFWDKNYMNIPEADWEKMGRLIFRTLNPLKHANGATDFVTITTFAWAEDVSMSMLTSTDSTTLTPQSGEIDEANQKGFLSGPATSVAKYAAYLKGVPYIGPFALATEVGATAMSSMAKIFGYCRPPVTKAPEPLRPTQTSSFALTNVPDNSQKLTVDEKQELTVDPRISGISAADPLNIREIAKRESFLTKFTWPIGTAPDTTLWNGRVDPCTFTTTVVPGGVAYHFPATAFAALPFQYWKGTMNFRFQVVCSSFHKGRIRVVYDPNFISSSTYLSYDEYNVNYLKIVDIAEEQDFTVSIGNGQEYSYLKHCRPGRDSQVELTTTGRYGFKAVGNGVVGISVVNELTTPNSEVNNDIEINVYVSMGDDFEVAAPDDYFQHFALAPQSGEMVSESITENESDAPQQAQHTILGLPPVDSSELNKVYFGEAITSFRPLLKRFSLWNVITKDRLAPAIISQRYPSFPYFRGRVVNAVDFDSAATPYNYVNTVLLHWVRVAFSGDRGSTRFKFMPRGVQNRGDRIEVQRAPVGGSGLTDSNLLYDLTVDSMAEYPNIVAARRDIMQDFAVATGDNVPEPSRAFPFTRGGTLTTSAVNGCLEVEIPYYSNLRFSAGKTADYTGSSSRVRAGFDVRAYFNGNSEESRSGVYDVYAAAGEDFQVYFFTGMPRMFFESNPPS